MTTLYKTTKKCSVCGEESEHPGIGSTNQFGSPDLDTRPPEMNRSTIFAWVRRCPNCGYCASDVAKDRATTKAVVASEEYKRQLSDSAYPALANSFLCQAMIERASGDFVAATWALIHAAWACDDAGQNTQAIVCRQGAADMLVTAEKNGQQVAQQEGATTAILTDLLRRSGQTERAREVIQTRRAGIAEDIIVRILDFQSTLLDRKDVFCHRIEEAL